MAKTSVTTVDNQTGEVVELGNAGEVRSAIAAQFKTKKRVTLPTLKQRVGMPIAVVFLTPMAEGKPIENSKITTPATVATVYNLLDSQTYQIICNTVTIKELQANYPDNGYVGKGFYIELHNAEGKNYKVVDMRELDIEGVELPKV